MENIFLVKIQKMLIKEDIYTITFLLEVSHTIKIQNFDHQNWSDFFCIRTSIFLCQAEQVIIFLGI